jgi:hypothetical protein
MGHGPMANKEHVSHAGRAPSTSNTVAFDTVKLRGPFLHVFLACFGFE